MRKSLEHDGGHYVWDSHGDDGLAGTTILSQHPTREEARAEIVRLTKLPLLPSSRCNMRSTCRSFMSRKLGMSLCPQERYFPSCHMDLKNLLAIGKVDEKPRNLNIMVSQNNILQLVAAYPDLRIRDSRLSAVCFEAERWPG